MKNSLLLLAFGIFITGATLTSCDTPEKNVDDAKTDLIEAQAKLAESIKDSTDKADWEAFKESSINQIAANKVEITNLKDKRDAKGTFMDPAYSQQISDLEVRNNNLQQRIDDYEKYNSNWSEFKREFNSDVQSIKESLKELTTDDKD